MPSVYVTGSRGSSGSVYVTGSSGGRGKPKKKGHGGVLGFVEHLGSDVGHAAVGIPMGLVQTVEHPIRTAKAIGKSYEQTYGPLLHGDVSKFLHGFYQHPLGPLLDVATLVTGGAAALGKVGEVGLLGEAGRGLARTEGKEILLRNEPALARAGRIKGLQAAAREHQPGATLGKAVPKNPARRAAARQLDRLLKMASPLTPVVGEVARFNRELDRLVRHEPLKLGLKVNDYRQAYTHLNRWEQLAFHFRATAVKPLVYAEHLRAQYAGKELPTHVAKTIALLHESKLLKAYGEPSTRLSHALARGRELADQMAQEHLTRAGGDPGLVGAFMERPYLHRRLLSGAEFDPEGGGFVGGRSVEELQREIAAEGLEQPFYLPDLAATRRLRDAFQRSGGGKGIPRPEESLRQNQGILFNTARLALQPEVLDRAFLAHTRFVLHSAIHDALVEHAVRIPRHSPLPKNYVFVRRHSAERLGATEKASGDVLARLDELVPNSNEAYQRLIADSAHDAEGAGNYRLAVHKSTVKRLAGEFARSESTFRLLFGNATKVWRALVLGLRVGFFTNNVVGNNLLYALRFAGVDGLRAYLRVLREVRGPAAVRRVLRATPPPTPELERLYREFAPELAAGTFGRTQFEGLGKTLSRGVGPLTAKVAEDIPRKAGFVGTISPAVRAAMKADGRNFLSRLNPDAATFATYARRALESDPKLAREAVDKVNAALGNYLNLSEFERRTVRSLVPFYGWLRAITQITLKAARDTPGRVDVLSKLGQIGTEITQDKLGPLPDYLQGLVPLGRPGAASATVLSTQGLNPFATVPQVTAGLGALVAGKPGQIGRGAASLGLNPYATGLIQALTGKELFTGKEIKGGAPGLIPNVLQQVGVQLPLSQLAAAAAGHGRSSKLYGRQGLREALLAYLGGPVKTLDLARAHTYASGR